MLENIKSVYFIKIVFFYMNERRKLKIIEYNKILQKKIDININNYKSFSGKTIIYETNIKGKEYDDNDELIFEGEYINGKRNGEGTEFNKFGTPIFEGDYLNGKREDYYYYGEIIFEGEYINGKRWNGKGYDTKNNVVYELIDGKGFIKELNANYELIFEGEYLNGKRNGKGKEYWIGELIFEGEYLNGKKWSGKGYDGFNNAIYEIKDGKGLVREYNCDGNLIFEGEYKNGERTGKGKEFSENGEIVFEGEFLNGKKWNGKGYDINYNIIYNLKYGIGNIKEYYDDGNIKFEGEYINGEKNGKGKEFNYNNELRFEGIFLYNHRIKGKQYIKGKLEYEGDYLFDKKWNGKGYDEDGNILYEIKNGNGKVIEYYNNGQIKYEGEYLNGLKNGKFIEYYESGLLKFEGEYLNGKRLGNEIE